MQPPAGAPSPPPPRPLRPPRGGVSFPPASRGLTLRPPRPPRSVAGTGGLAGAGPHDAGVLPGGGLLGAGQGHPRAGPPGAAGRAPAARDGSAAPASNQPQVRGRARRSPRHPAPREREGGLPPHLGPHLGGGPRPSLHRGSWSSVKGSAASRSCRTGAPGRPRRSPRHPPPRDGGGRADSRHTSRRGAGRGGPQGVLQLLLGGLVHELLVVCHDGLGHRLADGVDLGARDENLPGRGMADSRHTTSGVVPVSLHRGSLSSVGLRSD